MIRFRTWATIAGGVAAGILTGAGWALYTRRSRLRQASAESVDDPAIARAFAWVAGVPPMRLMRYLVARRAALLAGAAPASPAQSPIWIDLGCGPGLLVLELARRAPGITVVGVDLSDEMLAQAKERATTAGIAGQVAFHQGDAERIPLPDAAVDLVISTLSLHHWQEPATVLDEIARVLRPGGAFLIFDLRRDLAAPAWLLLWFVTRFVVPEPLRRANEPMGSRNAAYTANEAAALAQASRLRGWRVTQGPLWLMIEGQLWP